MTWGIFIGGFFALLGIAVFFISSAATGGEPSLWHISWLAVGAAGAVYWMYARIKYDNRGK